MARFVYSLQKVYELRERKKKEQEQVVNEALAALRKVAARLQAKEAEHDKLVQDLRHMDPLWMAMGRTFLEKLKLEAAEIEEERQAAHQRVKDEEAKLAEAHQAMEALEKHRENNREAWNEEQKGIEMKQLDEVGSQRYFRMMRDAAIEAELEGED